MKIWTRLPIGRGESKEEDDLSNAAKQSSWKYDIMIGVKERKTCRD